MAMNSSEKAIVKDMKLASLEVLRRTAHDVYEEKISVSGLNINVNKSVDTIIDVDPNDENHENDKYGNHDIDLLKFDDHELVRGRVIGRGAFCVVKECSLPSLITTITREEENSEGSDLSDRGRFRLRDFGRPFSRRKRKTGSNESALGTSSHSKGSSNYSSGSQSLKRYGTNYRNRYVIKQLSPELKRVDKINFLKGTVDLAMETRFLTLLHHENIVCLVGVASSGAFSDGYFIVLEKLSETLGKRVKVWMDMDRQCKGITGVFTGSKKKAQQLQSERISAACSLVAGMDFLHQKNIVFRDLVRIFFNRSFAIA